MVSMMGRPKHWQGLGLAGLLVLLATALDRVAAALLPITLATAGPGNLSHLPIELITRIGADRAEGVRLSVRYFGGGPLAYQDMLAGNSDFAVAGAPALADLAVKGISVVSVASVNRVPTFVLMVDKRLRGQVKDIADLRGRVIGINSSSRAARSTSQQVAEFLLRRAGIDPAQEVNFMPAGQTLAEQRAAFASGMVDALMGDEPFATALVSEGKAFVLLDLHTLKVCRRTMGGLFLNAQLSTRRDLLHREPQKVERMVRVLRRTLAWIAQHTPEEIVAALDIQDKVMRAQLLSALRRHKDIYSPDGAFTEEQIRTTQAFYRANQTPGSPGAAFDFRTLIEPRYAGMHPQ